MITAKQVKQLMTAKPFRPFRIHLSDGSHYDHDAAFVERNTVDVGINLDSDGIAESLVRCAILHIVKLEDIEAGVAH